jgi:hypothetical protein
MNTKKLLKYAAYYTAIASAYNYALNSYAAANPTSTLSLPKLPNPAIALVAGVLGTNAPLALTQATGGYGLLG